MANGKKVVLDGQLFCIGLPTGGIVPYEEARNDWDDAMVYQEQFSGDMRSLCQENFASKQLGQTFLAVNRFVYRSLWDTIPVTVRYGMAFRPILTPDIGGDQSSSMNVFDGIPNGQIFRMYSLLMGNEPIRMDTEEPTDFNYLGAPAITFTDQYFGDEYLIPWVIFDGRALAQRNLLQTISWTDLHDQGYVL